MEKALQRLQDLRTLNPLPKIKSPPASARTGYIPLNVLIKASPGVSLRNVQNGPSNITAKVLPVS